jgi:hypothetical protein
MKKLIIAFAFIVTLFPFSKVKAQDDSYFNMYYSMSLATGKFNDYMSPYSWRGFGMEWRAEEGDKLMIGVRADWNTFYKAMDYGTYESGTQSISGKQYRYTNTFPMALTPSYYKDFNETARLTLGCGIGTTYLMRDTDFGVYRIEKNTWQFLLAPEATFTFDLDANRALYLGVRYNNNFNSSKLDGQSFLQFNVGLSYNQ